MAKIQPNSEPTKTEAYGPNAGKQRIPQSQFPSNSLEKALVIPRTIVDQFGGRAGEPNQIALAAKWTPTGGMWRTLTGAAMAYGLTEGGYGATEIKLTSRGSAIVAPTEENGDKPHLRAAILEPTIMKAFIEKYDGAKFPTKEIGINVLAGMGLPRERCPDAFDLIEENLRYVGALAAVKTGHMVLLSVIGSPLLTQNGVAGGSERLQDDEMDGAIPPLPPHGGGVSTAAPIVQGPAAPAPPISAANVNVFISHGKSRELVETLKKAVSYGKFKPIVSVEITDTSKPVPQKVMQEMRSCFGGIVHVRNEGHWTDPEGKPHPKINDNVLIEIGAAMAMYKENFILLVERGTQLPSNLQGLFVCYYDGDKLDGDATMQLLEGLSKFQPGG